MKNTGTKHSLELTTPSDREIAMKRVFDAPPTLVFDAFTKPELLKRWLLGPDGWSMPDCNVDLRPGGAFHYGWRNDADGTEFGLSGTYREIVRPERIVHVERFDGALDSGEALITTTFVEQNGSTTVTMTMLMESRAARDMTLESGMERGVAASYDRLAGILGQTAA
jgi:uncharacterized protein YndB with AHSA1/START domain